MSLLSDPVALTQKLIQFDTINPPGQEAACAHYLGDLLEGAGFRVAYHEFAQGRTSVVARRGGEQRPLCFTGHIDTVPLGTQPWRVDPFAGEIRDGKLYGRGASDMKSGVAAFVAAAAGMADVLDDGPGVVLVITAGEETGCEGAFHLTRAGDALGKAGAVVVAEPTGNYPMVGHKGALWLEARTRGVTAHGSMPEKGDNAIYKAARAVSRLERFEFEDAPHAVLGPATLNVGTINGGMNVNSVPDSTRIRVDIRTVPGMEHSRLRGRLGQYLAPDVDGLEAFIDLEGVWTDADHPWIRNVFDVMQSVLGERPEIRSATYFTDASALTPHYGGVSTVILGPGEAGMAHQTDEYCYTARIEQAAAAYGALLRNWQSVATS